MTKLVINEANKTKFLGIGGENIKDKPYALPTNKKNLVVVGKGGKIQRASLNVAPRITKKNHFGKKVTVPVIDIPDMEYTLPDSQIQEGQVQ